MGLEEVRVFEDDAELRENFVDILERAMEELPQGAELLYFGGSHREKPTRISRHLMAVTRTLTTHGYIMKRSGFEAAIEILRANTEPVDCAMVEFQKRGTSYITDPPIAWQQAGFSDIERRDMDYPWIESNEQ